MRKTVYLSLGSNMGAREEHLQRAIDLLAARRVEPLRCSPVYETEPQDLRDQPWFLNLVLEARTEYFPLQLLAQTAAIERELGRQRLVANGPRTIDIDILVYGRHVVETPALTIPHPRMTARRFVLQPLVDLAPHLRHPILGQSMKELLGALAAQAVRRVPFTPRLPATEPGD